MMKPHEYTWLFVCTLIAAFTDGYGIGANDVANSFSTSVSSGSLTLPQACLIACFTEFFGAFLLGAGTTSTIRDGIINLKLFAGKPEVLMLGMFCALVGSSIWTILATRMGWPVSTTHSIVGAIIGFGISGFGFGAVKWSWDGLGKIIASWFISPVLAAIVASLIFSITKYLVLKKENSFQRGLYAIPVYFGVTLFIDVLYVLLKNGKGPGDLAIGYTILIVIGCALLVAALCWFLFVPWLKRKILNREELYWYHILIIPFVAEKPKVADKSEEAGQHEETVEVKEKPTTILGKVKAAVTHGFTVDVTSVAHDPRLQAMHDDAIQYDANTEYMYSFLQVVTASMASFAHGSNDVSNAIGPLSAVYHIWETGLLPTDKTEVPLWVLALGGAAIDIGLVTYGYNIMKCLGNHITFHSPSRGFSMELGASLTVLTASKLNIPVSTTHCITGATAGVGLCSGKWNAVNWRLVAQCFFSWIVTVPCAALMSGLVFAFASRAPTLPTN
jgi:sodium-dependent phosphate transporter